AQDARCGPGGRGADRRDRGARRAAARLPVAAGGAQLLPAALAGLAAGAGRDGARPRGARGPRTRAGRRGSGGRRPARRLTPPGPGLSRLTLGGRPGPAGPSLLEGQLRIWCEYAHNPWTLTSVSEKSGM